MDHDHDSPQGPVDPHGPGGIDAPAPPGGPQRTDSPSGPQTPGEAAPDPGIRRTPGKHRADGPADRDAVPEPTQEGHEPSDEERRVQQENAASSLDQPSQ